MSCTYMGLLDACATQIYIDWYAVVCQYLSLVYFTYIVIFWPLVPDRLIMQC